MIPLICGILKKKSTNEPFYKTEIESQHRNNLWLPRGKGEWEGEGWPEDMD